MWISTLLCAAALMASPPNPAPPSAPPVVSVQPVGKVFLTIEEALDLVFPDVEVTKSTIYLTEEQRVAAAKRGAVDIDGRVIYHWVATKDDAVVGEAYVDVHRVRTLRETLMFVLDPEGKIERLEMLSFGEPEDYIPPGAFYGQFIGLGQGDRVTLKGDIRGVTGATLTARATTQAARRVLAIHTELNPPPEPEPEPEPERPPIKQPRDR